MSAWPIPDEVVEVAFEFFHHSRRSKQETRDFLERHRLAVIPEGHGVVRLVEAPPFEPSWDLDDGLDRIPGQPITVDKEEKDG